MKTGIKKYGVIVLLNIIQACSSEQQPRGAGQSPQKPPADTLNADSLNQSMPVLKPDTAKQEEMPAVLPPANVQPK